MPMVFMFELSAQAKGSCGRLPMPKADAWMIINNITGMIMCLDVLESAMNWTCSVRFQPLRISDHFRWTEGANVCGSSICIKDGRKETGRGKSTLWYLKGQQLMRVSEMCSFWFFSYGISYIVSGESIDQSRDNIYRPWSYCVSVCLKCRDIWDRRLCLLRMPRAISHVTNLPLWSPTSVGGIPAPTFRGQQQSF